MSTEVGMVPSFMFRTASPNFSGELLEAMSFST